MGSTFYDSGFGSGGRCLGIRVEGLGLKVEELRVESLVFKVQFCFLMNEVPQQGRRFPLPLCVSGR